MMRGDDPDRQGDEPYFPDGFVPQRISPSPPPQRGSAPRLVTDNKGLAGRGLGKSFKKRVVLRDVNISVQRGEVVGLLGPNGAGKTTCFYIITGFIGPATRGG